jgi:hypothetical protein
MLRAIAAEILLSPKQVLKCEQNRTFYDSKMEQGKKMRCKWRVLAGS